MSIAYLQEKVSTTSLRSVPLTVLYVASDGSRRDNLRCILRQSNWNLLSASNLEEARQQLGAQPVSVLLLDWLVPEAVCSDLLELAHDAPYGPEIVMLVPPEREDDMFRLFPQHVHGVFGPDYRPEEIRTMVSLAGRCWHDRLPRLAIHFDTRTRCQ